MTKGFKDSKGKFRPTERQRTSTSSSFANNDPEQIPDSEKANDLKEKKIDKLDDDQFLVIWDVATQRNTKYDPLWNINGDNSPAEIMKPEKSYRILKHLASLGLVNLRPTNDLMDYNRENPNPTFYADITPKGLEFFNSQEEKGRLNDFPKVDIFQEYYRRYGMMNPEERLEIFSKIIKSGLDKEFGKDMLMTTNSLIEQKIFSKSGEVLDKEKFVENFSK